MPNRDRSRNHLFLSFLTVFIIVIADRALKNFFIQRLALGESIPVIKNIFHFTLVRNTGIAFGLFKNQGLLFTLIPVGAIIFIVVHLFYRRQQKTFAPLYIFGCSLILGGAIGNLFDRLLFGYVIDFLDFRVWPVFNLADSAITVGVAILILKCIPSFAK